MPILKVFAVIVPIMIIWSIVTGEIVMMNQLDKSHSSISFSDNPFGFIMSIGALGVLEFYLLKTINSSRGEK